MTRHIATDADTAAHLALSRLPTVKFGVYDLMEEHSDAASALGALEKIRPCDEISAARTHAEREMRAAERAGVAIVALSDPRYPELLRHIPDRPLALYVRGRLDYSTPIAIVGSRKPSAYGLTVAERFSRDLAARGACVVSGLAFGVDAAAHRGALAGKGITVAVLGSGLNRLYPRQHDRLAASIVAGGGAVISEFPMNMEPHAGNFPRRNRIIAGLSQGVCVVEAAKRSGSLITARLGGEYGRMVWAVPNRVGEELSEGIIALLRDGAIAVANADQILEDVAPSFQKNLRSSDNRGMVADAVLDAISIEGGSFDEIVARSAQGRERVATRLLELELEGRVATMAGGIYRRIV